MGWLCFVLFVSVTLSLSAHQMLAADPKRTLAAGERLSVNQTILSEDDTFELGFFSPGNSTTDRRWYVGIWYHDLPPRTVVWVANREAPLMDPAGVLTVTDGNIAVLDDTGRTLWSTNVTRLRGDTDASAVLLCTGNLVLRHGRGDGQKVWESFDHPTDTLLPQMNMRSNFRTGVGLRIAAWRGPVDPSPGRFQYAIDPKTSLQQYIYNGSEIYWRSAPWDGMTFLNVKLGNLTAFYARSIVKNDDEIIWSFTVNDKSVHARFVLNYTGVFIFYFWENGRWEVLGSLPVVECDFYNHCGPFGACTFPQRSCTCLEGFEPRRPEDWKVGNFTAGCVRRRQPRWDGTDKFVKVSKMKLPDGFSVFWNKSSARNCQAECSGSSRCQAYSYAEFSSLNRSGSRCLVWLGEVTDMSQSDRTSEDLYVRLHSGKNQKWLKILLPVVSFAILLTGLCCILFIKRRRDARKTWDRVLAQGLELSIALGSEKRTADVAFLDFEVVKAITSNFSSGNKLGEGGFGHVYKGTFLNGQQVAVKRMSKGSNQGYKEFENEVGLIAKLQHNNLVWLLGWCSHKDEKILIYEYMPNGSLDKLVFDISRSAELNWEKRFGIIKGIANGLLYLHEHSRMRVIHRDLKTSNILLDSVMNPRISDFGLARTFATDQNKGNTEIVAGTYGYMAPEYALNGVFSEKSDVFSFGVIILELVTGIRSTGFYPESNADSLFAYSWRIWEEDRALELVDPSTPRSSSSDAEVIKCIQLGMLCIQEAPADRPSMSSIVSSLSNAACSLPMPKKPAFVMVKDFENVQLSPPDRSFESPTNELTVSSVAGR